MRTYSLVMETKDRWEAVDAGNTFSTALRDRGASPVWGQSGLVWSVLADARAAARWLAGTCKPGEGVQAVCVVRENANGDVLLRAKVRKLTRKERRAEILKLARLEGEVDDDAKVSEGDDNGAYVQAWVWVSFAGTALDKDGDK